MDRAINLRRMKKANKRMLLEALWLKPSTRSELADRFRLTRASITMQIDELIKEGFIQETDVIKSGVGRHPIMLQIVLDAYAIIGINIKRKKIDVGFTDLGGRVIEEKTISQTDEAPSEIITRVIDAILDLQGAISIPDERILGVGICAPGPLNGIEGVILNPPNFHHWHNTPVKDQIKKRLKKPVSLMSVSDALVLEEKYLGDSKDEENLMVMQVDDGIGSGIIIHNRLFRSQNNHGGILGHTSIDYNGRLCSCGNKGCLEVYASLPSILNGSGFDRWKDVVDAAPTSKIATEIICREAEYLSTSIVNSINLFDLNRIVINGELDYGHELLAQKMETLVWPRIIMRDYGDNRSILFTNKKSYVSTGAIGFLYSYFHEYKYR